MSKLPPAGNNVQTLQSKPAAPHTSNVAELMKTAADRLAAAKEHATAVEAAAQPTPSATHPPTGPASVEFKEPIKASKSAAGPAPSIIHEPLTVHAPNKDAKAVQNVSAPTSIEARVTALEARLSDFNKRSGQKI